MVHIDALARSRLLRAAFCVIAAAGAAGASSRALAQAAGPQAQKAQGLEEITVTASRRKELLQEAPIAVTAISASAIKDLDIRNQEVVQLLTPSMTFSAQDGYAQVYLRGIGTNYPDPGLESPVALYRDDTYTPGGAGSVLDLVDLSGVQVLNGPQGTLYGRNASGGVILINTADPTDEEEGRLSAEYGRFGHRQFDLIVNEPITEDLRVRFAGRSLDDEGYIRNVFDGQMLGGQSAYTARVKIDWTPEAVPGLDVLWMTEYVHDHEYHDTLAQRLYSPLCLGCGPGNEGRAVGYYDTNQNIDAADEFQSWLNNLHITYEFGSYTLKSVTSYYKTFFGGKGSDQDYSPVNLFNYLEESPGWEYSEDVTLASNYGGRLEFIGGLYYLRELRDSVAGLAGSALGDLATELGFPGDFPKSNANVRTDSGSAFIEGSYKLMDDLKFTAGVRYNIDRRTLDTENNAVTAAIFGMPGIRQQKTYYSLTPRFVLSYKTDYGDFYVSDTKGFKSGGFTTPSFGINPIVNPEKIHSEEIGLKSTWLQGRLRTNIDVFHYKDTGLQVSVIDVLAGGNVTENAGSAEATGVEFTSQYRVNDQLLLGFGGDYLHARFSQFKNPALYCPTPDGLVSCTFDVSGSVLPHAPEWQGYVTADYQVPVFDGWNANVDVLAHWSDRFKYFTAGGGPLDRDQQNAFWVVNINAYLMSDDEKYRVGFYIDNALNTKYADLKTTAGPYGAIDMVAPPLTFGIKLSYKFLGK